MSVLKSILLRFKEPSSWAGVTGLLVLLNINLEPGLLDQIVIVGAGISGLIAFFLPDA